MSANERRSVEPTDRKTRIASRVSELIENDPEYIDGDKAIVTVLDSEGGGIGLFGYENDVDAMVDLFVMLRAIARANGRDLEYVGIPDSPEALDDQRQ